MTKQEMKEAINRLPRNKKAQLATLAAEILNGCGEEYLHYFFDRLGWEVERGLIRKVKGVNV
jgi:hypothetical protein